MIPEKRDGTQCNVLHEKILNKFKLVDKGNEQGQLWIECDSKKILKYRNNEFTGSVVVIKQEEMIEDRDNIDTFNFLYTSRGK